MRAVPGVLPAASSFLILAFSVALTARCGEPATRHQGGGATPVGRARTVTLAKSLRLSQALQELAAQTGVTVEDRRRDRGEDPGLKLALDRATFWQALDAVAREADLRVDLYKEAGKVCLVDGPNRAVPVSYSGIFRVTVVHVETAQDFETGDHLLGLRLQVAWEPQFKPVFLEGRPQAAEVKDDKGNTLEPLAEGAGRVGVQGGLATTLRMLVKAPRRASAKLALLKGDLSMIGPSRTLRFTYDDLAALQKASEKQARTETKEGVAVTLRAFKVEQDRAPQRWTATFGIKYPAGGPGLDSNEFQTSVVTTKVRLVKRDNPKVVVTPGGEETDEEGNGEAVLSYTFVEDKDVKLGKPGQWKLVYEPPGPLVSLPVKFEFKDLPLP